MRAHVYRRFPRNASMDGMRAQGATEYLVLLAVVLIVALVSVALLGFFPGMASDAQLTQSKAYWSSASPISITEWGARMYNGDNKTYVYFRVRNLGNYPILITGIVGADGTKITSFWSNAVCTINSSGLYPISNYYYLAPGEEKYFGTNYMFGLPCDRTMIATTGTSQLYYIPDLAS